MRIPADLQARAARFQMKVACIWIVSKRRLTASSDDAGAACIQVPYAQACRARPGRNVRVALLDDSAPDFDAVALCAHLRRLSGARHLYILVLLAKPDTNRALEAFAAGADDCLDDPPDRRVLWAHVRALTRRYAPAPAVGGTLIKKGSLSLDVDTSRLAVDGRSVSLTKTELGMLSLLLRRAGSVVRREDMLAELRGRFGETDSHTLTVHISNLRRKLAGGGTILSVKGLGYQLDIDSSVS